jgi:hypothetical protein
MDRIAGIWKENVIRKNRSLLSFNFKELMVAIGQPSRSSSELNDEEVPQVSS